MSEPVSFAGLARRSRRDRAIDNARHIEAAFQPVSMPRGVLLGRDRYRELLERSELDAMERGVWEDNVQLAMQRGEAEAENLSRLRGCFSALCALREAVRQDPSDTEAREFGGLLRDYLAQVWSVPRVPDGIAEREALARAVIRGLMS